MIRLAYSALKDTIDFKDNSVNMLIIENGAAYRKAMQSFVLQAAGDRGEFVLSQDYKIIDFAKNIEFISDIFALDFSSRRFSSKINQEALKIIAEKEDEARLLMAKINAFAASVVFNMETNVSFTEVEDMADVVKLFGLYIAQEEMDLPEKLLEYMRLCRSFFNKQVFVISNIQGSLLPNEFASFINCILYEKFSVLLVENHQRYAPNKNMHTYVLDEQLCEL